jgi:DNA invertase Pin-like site-specific DNA recombinase
MAAVAELERTRIRERQAEGIAKAKQKGKYKGRSSEYEQHIPIVRSLLEMGKGSTYIAKQINISRTTVYKIKKELELDGQIAMEI